MSKRPLSPTELATRIKRVTVSFSLSQSNVDSLRKLADSQKPPIPLSTLVDEAITYYLESLKEKDSK
jgi:hypothetical protein